MHNERNSGIAILLSFLVPGAGSLYTGKIAKGVALILINFVSWFAGVLIGALIAAALGVPTTGDMTEAKTLVLLFMILVPLITWVYSMYAAYADAEKYNACLRRDGNPPW